MSCASVAVARVSCLSRLITAVAIACYWLVYTIYCFLTDHVLLHHERVSVQNSVWHCVCDTVDCWIQVTRTIPKLCHTVQYCRSLHCTVYCFAIHVSVAFKCAPLSVEECVWWCECERCCRCSTLSSGERAQRVRTVIVTALPGLLRYRCSCCSSILQL